MKLHFGITPSPLQLGWRAMPGPAPALAWAARSRRGSWAPVLWGQLSLTQEPELEGEMQPHLPGKSPVRGTHATSLLPVLGPALGF